MAILERSGIPSSAITVLPSLADGTETEVAAIAAFIKEQGLSSVLVVTARSHTGRTKWLLHRTLGDSVHVSVRSPRFDTFSVEGWWRERDQCREVIAEYLRWTNTLVLPNLWAAPRRRQPVATNRHVVVAGPLVEEAAAPWLRNDTKVGRGAWHHKASDFEGAHIAARAGRTVTPGVIECSGSSRSFPRRSGLSPTADPGWCWRRMLDRLARPTVHIR